MTTFNVWRWPGNGRRPLTVVKVLETALRTTTPSLTEGPRPQEPFLTEEICAPFTLPRPKGERVVPIEITGRKPSPHDLPETE
jgi:hypothetical protein